MLEFFSSSNGVVNSKRAVDECLENALSPTDTDCDLIMFHTSVGHDFDDLLVEMRRLAPSAKIAGCTGAGVVGSEGSNETPRGLAILAIKGEEFAATGIESIIDTDPYEIGAKLATDLAEQQPEVNMVVLFTSFIDIYPADRAIEGIESVLGKDVVISGGCANDNGIASSNWQFFDEHVFERGTVAVGFADPSIEVIVRSDHGHEVFGEPFHVTRSNRHRVYEFDDIPAWRFITQRAGLDESVEPKSPAASGIWGLALEIPEYLHKDYGRDYTIHLGSPFRQEDGSLLMGVSCPVGSRLWIARRSDQLTLEGTERVATEIRQSSNRRTPIAVFDADCAMRGHFMFNRFLKEELVVKTQQPLCGDEGIVPPWLGFYSGGEFCRIGNHNWYHAFTMTLTALFRKEVTPSAS